MSCVSVRYFLFELLPDTLIYSRTCEDAQRFVHGIDHPSCLLRRVMKEYEELGPKLRGAVFSAGAARLRAGQKALGEAYDLFRYSGDLRAQPPKLTLNSTCEAEEHWSLVLRTLKRDEEDSLKDRILNLHSGGECGAAPLSTSAALSVGAGSSSAIFDSLATAIAENTKMIKRVVESSARDGKKNESSKKRSKADGDKAEAPRGLNADDVFDMFENKKRERHLVRFSSAGKALEAYPVDVAGAKKELPRGSCALHHLCRSFKRKAGVWCEKPNDEEHEGGGAAHSIVKGFKPSKYIDRSKEKRIVAAATIASLIQGTRCATLLPTADAVTRQGGELALAQRGHRNAHAPSTAVVGARAAAVLASEQDAAPILAVQTLIDGDNGSRWEPGAAAEGAVDGVAVDGAVALLLEQAPNVANVDRNEGFDLLVDRSTTWGNFSHPLRKNATDAERQQSVVGFARSLLRDDERVSAAQSQLKGKLLACHCAPKLCHAHVLSLVANASPASLAELRELLLDQGDGKGRAVAKGKAAGADGLALQSLRDALHPNATLASTYVECEHGWVLVQGQLDKTIDKRCQQIACVKKARAWWLANRAMAMKALTSGKGFTTAAPWTDVAGALGEKRGPEKPETAAASKRQRALPLTEKQPVATSAAASKITVVNTAAHDCKEPHAVSTAWPAALASPFVADPSTPDGNLIAAYEELLVEPSTVELATIAELHDVQLVEGAELDAKRDAQRRVEALKAATRLLELGAPIGVCYDGSGDGLLHAGQLKKHLECACIPNRRDASSQAAPPAKTAKDAAKQKPGAMKQATKRGGKRVAFAAGLVASVQGLQLSTSKPLCMDAPMIAAKTNVTCTVLVPVLLAACVGGCGATSDSDGQRADLFALLPSARESVFGRVDGELASTKSSSHESAVQRALDLAGTFVDGYSPVAMLAGELDVGVAPDGRVQKMRIVALPLSTHLQGSKTDAWYGWPLSDATDAQSAWRTLDFAKRDERLFAIVASAMQRVQSQIDTAPSAPEQLRVGALRTPVLGTPHEAEGTCEGPSFDELLRRGTQLALSFQRRLREMDGDDDFRRFCAGMADRVKLPVIDEIASVFKGKLPSYEQAGLERLPFERPCQPPATTSAAPSPSRPLPSFAPEAAGALDSEDPIEQITFEIGADGLPTLGAFWPTGIHQVVRPWARKAMLQRLRAIAAWHELRKQGLSEEQCVAQGRGRPRGIAFGDDAVYPIARGRVWSFAQLLPGGDGLVRDISDEWSRETHISVEATRSLLADASDRAIVDFGCGGGTLGLDAVMPLWSYVVPPLLSLYSPFEGTDGTFADAIARETPKIVERGWCELAGFEQNGDLWLFTWPFRCDAQGAVPKPRASPPEPRGVVDKSGPHEEQLQLSSMPKKLGGNVRKPAPFAPHVPSLNKLDEEHYTLHEPKPSSKTVATNHSILRSIADPAGMSLLVIVWDYYKFFHQFLYVVTERWMMGRLVPTLAADGATGALQLARDLVLVMGVHSASKYAQRFVDTVHAAFMRSFFDSDQRSFSGLPTDTQQVLRWRDSALPYDAYGSHANLLDIQTYLDDPCACVVDDPSTAERSLSFVRRLYDFIGPLGINLLFAEWSKWDLGVDAKWLGVMHAPALGLITLTRDRAMRALERTQVALRGELEAYPYQRLVGLFVSLVEACGLDRRMLFFLQGPLRRGGELEQGESTLVRVQEHVGLARTLRKWEQQLLFFPGSVMLAAVRRSPPPREARRLFLRSDAAVEGTEHPGLGGVLLSSWWRFALSGVLLELPMAIHEQVAYGTNFVVYAQALAHAPLIAAEADASATPMAVGGRARADGMREVSELITSLPQYRAVAKRLVMDHAFGAGNVLADASSRGYIDVLEMLGAQLGMQMQQRQLDRDALRFLATAYARVLRERGISLHRLPVELSSLGVSPASNAHDGPPGMPRVADSSSSGDEGSSFSRFAGAKQARLAHRERPPQGKRACASGVAACSGAPLSSSDDEVVGASRASSLGSPAQSGRATGGSAFAPPPIAPDTPPVPLLAPPPPRPLADAVAQRQARGIAANVTSASYAERATAAASNASRDERVGTHPHVRMRADTLYAKLRADKSIYALAVEDDELDSMCLFMAGEADGDEDAEERARDPFRGTAWKKWTAYCEAKNTTPWRDDHAANLGLDADGYERELTLWACALPWIYARMEPRRGWTTPPRPQSAMKHLRTVHSLLRKHGCSPPPLKHVAARCFKMMRRYLRENGSEALLPQQKEPFTTQMIVDMLSHEGPTRGGGSRARKWDWSSHEGVTWCAWMHTYAQTGFRNADSTSKYKMRKSDLSMGHLKWKKVRDQAPRVLELEELEALEEGDYAVLTPPPSKSDPLGMRWGSKPIHLPYEPSAQICAARALRNLELMRRVSADKRRETPLFSDEEGKILTPSYTARTLRSFVELIVSSEFVKDYTPHSFRIYLCNALAAADMSDAVIQMCLRWASVDALNTYRMTDAKAYAQYLQAAAQATFVVRRGAQTMPTRADGRPLPTIDGDDRIAAIVDEAVGLMQIAEDHDDE